MCCTCNTAAVLRRAGVITPQAARGATPVAAIRRYYSAHSEFRFSSLYILLSGNRHTYLASHLHNYATSKNGYSVSDRPCISKARQKVQVTQWWLAPLRWQTCFPSPPRRLRSAVIAIHDFRTKLLATRETRTKPTS